MDCERSSTSSLNNKGRSDTPLTVLNTNARSLVPKLVSFTDCFSETDARIAIVTETWLRDGSDLEKMAEDLSLGEGIGILTKNRDPNPNGVCYGGVAVLWKESLCNFKSVTCRNVNNYEVLPCVGSIRGQARKLVVVACLSLIHI